MSTPAREEVIALEERLTELLGTHDVHPDDRIAIQQAFVEFGSWDRLPQEIRDRIAELEQLPPQAWDDPLDVPDDLDDDSKEEGDGDQD